MTREDVVVRLLVRAARILRELTDGDKADVCAYLATEWIAEYDHIVTEGRKLMLGDMQ